MGRLDECTSNWQNFGTPGHPHRSTQSVATCHRQPKTRHGSSIQAEDIAIRDSLRLAPEPAPAILLDHRKSVTISKITSSVSETYEERFARRVMREQTRDALQTR
jgi:hypothetical protein